jgi:phosphoglycolate phosphatase-like HAD superfamily hydrolase
MLPRLILFDIDGTLTRSLNGFIAFNEAVEKTFGFPGDIRTVIPDGASLGIFARLFPTATPIPLFSETSWQRPT